MKRKLLALALLSVGVMFAQISVGIQIGPPPQPRIIRVRPVQPGPGYSYVDGYWYANNGRYNWHDGYWTRPPYESASWMQPRYEGGRFYQGFWSAPNREPYGHDHKWDRDKHNRDYDRDEKHEHKEKGHGRGHDR
jgi:hypothetical protein